MLKMEREGERAQSFKWTLGKNTCVGMLVNVLVLSYGPSAWDGHRPDTMGNK